MNWVPLMFAVIIIVAGVVFFKSFYNDYDENPIVVGRQKCDGIILLGISLALAAPLLVYALMLGPGSQPSTNVIVMSIAIDLAIASGIYRWLRYWSDDAIEQRQRDLVDYDASRRN